MYRSEFIKAILSDYFDVVGEGTVNNLIKTKSFMVPLSFSFRDKNHKPTDVKNTSYFVVSNHLSKMVVRFWFYNVEVVQESKLSRQCTITTQIMMYYDEQSVMQIRTMLDKMRRLQSCPKFVEERAV